MMILLTSLPNEYDKIWEYLKGDILSIFFVIFPYFTVSYRKEFVLNIVKFSNLEVHAYRNAS